MLLDNVVGVGPGSQTQKKNFMPMPKTFGSWFWLRAQCDVFFFLLLFPAKRSRERKAFVSLCEARGYMAWMDGWMGIWCSTIYGIGGGVSETNDRDVVGLVLLRDKTGLFSSRGQKNT